jgi:predicted nucleotidyltransferase
VDVAAQVTSALERHPAITAVRLVGSRQRGAAGDLSDWDFEVDTVDFAAVANDLPALVSPLRPLAQQWDRLSTHATYMLILCGPVKVDLIFDRPHEPEPVWKVSAETLQAVDHHFWDWILWMAAKQSGGKHELVQQEFDKMSSNLLRPMGVERVPDAVETAVALYTSARRELENRLGVEMSKELENEIRPALRRSGYDV